MLGKVEGLVPASSEKAEWFVIACASNALEPKRALLDFMNWLFAASALYQRSHADFAVTNVPCSLRAWYV